MIEGWSGKSSVLFRIQAGDNVQFLRRKGGVEKNSVLFAHVPVPKITKYSGTAFNTGEKFGW
jgi:hypothetical protein